MGETRTVEENGSIADAVETATEGDTIEVSAGSYDGDVIVRTDGLTLAGPNADGSEASDDRSGAAEITGRIVVEESVADVRIDGFEIATAGSAAIEVHAGSEVTIANNRILGAEGSDGTGVEVGPGSDGDPALVTVSDNRFEDLRDGIRLSGVDGDSTIASNAIADVAVGVRTAGEAQSGFEITDNEITNASTGAIVVGGTFEDEHRITENDVEDGETGVAIYGGGDVLLEGNVIQYNGAGIRVHEGADVGSATITKNNLVGNDEGLVNEADETVEATHNWWGDAAGPSGEGQGIGDSVSGNVDFHPWFPHQARTVTENRL